MPKTLCIYHANCADGLGAAWAVHRALGNDVEFVAAKYGEGPPPAHEWRKDEEVDARCVRCGANPDDMPNGTVISRAKAGPLRRALAALDASASGETK